jgi:hypothetical protein
MSSRLTRFLRLERPRAPGADAPKLANEERFGIDEDAEIRRLREERRKQFESGVETLEEHPDAQPFVRCAVCEADNSRYALRCTNCGANLNTPEQRAFNARLWEARRAAEGVAPPPQDVPVAAAVVHDEAAEPASLGVRMLTAFPQSWRPWIVAAVLAEIAGTGIRALASGEQPWGLACGVSIAVVIGVFLPPRRR